MASTAQFLLLSAASKGKSHPSPHPTVPLSRESSIGKGIEERDCLGGCFYLLALDVVLSALETKGWKDGRALDAYLTILLIP